jgi:endonuclease/exonuclease/phosphatase (EEP) superfamily protein YafD
MYGVVNAFNIFCESNELLITKKRELKFATYKSILITKHLLNNKKITVVNIHALNFVIHKDFKYELEILKDHLQNDKDALIVAGDFNTWNKKRVILLNEFCKELSLEQVSFNNDKNIKKVFNNCLDYIFFRGLKLEYAKVINSKSISDHNPIIASFTL